MNGKRIVMRVTLGAIVVAMSGCAVYGHHGRVRVGVAFPAVIPIPIPLPRHEPQPEYPQPPPAPPPATVPAPSPPTVDRQVYPSAGAPRGGDGSYVEYGAVRSLEASPYRGMVRVGVMLDNRGLRYVDLPGTNLRIGERVRMEGDRIYRD